MADSPAEDSVLSARDVHHTYGDVAVLRGVDVDMRRGEVVALLGPNGSGKTTLMSVLVGLLRPRGGSVKANQQAVGWVPQGRSIYPRLTVRENLVLFARLRGHSARDAQRIARDAADEADLTEWIDRVGWQLSGGLRQRLNVAVGMLDEPDVVVLDEPTTGVDLLHRTALWAVLRKRADEGASVLYSTHTLEDAQVADRVLVLVGGRIVWDGPLAGLAQVPAAQSARDHAADSEAVPHAIDPVARGLIALWTNPQAQGNTLGDAHGGKH